jgi:hypothetical protein
MHEASRGQDDAATESATLDSRKKPILASGDETRSR